jgi:flavin reductase (DIM6/NTAB) family NADH-FMN oxidoreductase RutF
MSTATAGSAAFRDALAHFASGVTVVAASGSGGPLGFTATGFTSVSLSPPLILVCVGKGASVHDGIVGSLRFGVSILSERQEWIAQQFARSGVDRFREVALRPTIVPLVEGALAALECRRHARHDAGDHTILVGEVIDTFVGTGRPLVHCTRRFGTFVADGPRTASQQTEVREGGRA